MVKHCLALGLVAAACAWTAAGAESAAPTRAAQTPARHDEYSYLVGLLGADDWADREYAMQLLSEAGGKARPALSAGLARSSDPEVQLRLRRLLVRFEELPVEGTYTQLSHDAWDTDGGRCQPSNLDAYGTFVIGPKTVVWTQKYRGESAVQEYSYAGFPGQRVIDGLRIELKWEKIETDSGGYNPDKINPCLLFRKNSDGVRVIFSYTDTAGNRGRIVLTPGLLPPPPEDDVKKEDMPLPPRVQILFAPLQREQ